MSELPEKTMRTCPRCDAVFAALRAYCVCPECKLKFKVGDRWPPLPPLPETISFHAVTVVAQHAVVHGEDVIALEFQGEREQSLHFVELTTKREKELVRKNRDWDDASLPGANARLQFDGHKSQNFIDDRLHVKLYNGKAIFNCDVPFFQGPTEIVVTFDPLPDFEAFGLLADDCFRRSGKYKRFKRAPKRA